MKYTPELARKINAELLVSESVQDLIADGTVFDVCFVFGTRHVRKICGLVDRLYTAGLFRYLVVSGGDNERLQENETQAIVCGLKQVPISLIYAEQRATNTKENVSKSIPLLSAINRRFSEEIGIRKILLVGRVHAALRYLMTMKQQLATSFEQCVQMKIATINEHRLPVKLWKQDPVFKRYLVEECAKIETYLAAGDIAPVTKDEYGYFV